MPTAFGPPRARNPAATGRSAEFQRSDAYELRNSGKALTPNNFADLPTLERTLLGFGRRYEQIARPFEWKFTRKDLQKVLDRIEQANAPPVQLAA